MKKSLLTLLVCVTFAAVNAQNPESTWFKDRRVDTYRFAKGGDSMRFVIVGTNDTVQIANYYRNGHLKTVIWKKDSLYKYDGLGRLVEKLYRLDNENQNGEDVIHFFDNGQVAFSSITDKQDITQTTFDTNGHQVVLEQTKYTPNYTYKSVCDKNNVPISITKTDTVIRHNGQETIEYDTIFYENRQPFRIRINDSEKGNVVLNWYNKDGSLIKSLLPDSVHLKVFKDNVDCYYGLKNKQGDTIVKPRFDRIEHLNNDFIAVYNNEHIILLQPNGAPISTNFTHLTDIKKLYDESQGRYYRRKNYRNYNDAERAVAITNPINYYRFVDNGRYGVMTDKGDILVPPQYFKLESEDFNDADFFKFNDNKNNSLIRVGYINRNGENIFSDAFKGVYYTYVNDYFFLSSRAFYKRRPFKESAGGESDRVINLNYLSNFPSENTCGLGKRDGTVLLDAKFNRLQHVWADFFIASVVKGRDADKQNIYRTGIYNARIGKMILDTTDFIIPNDYSYRFPYFVVQQVSSQKYGLVDTTGKAILPFTYDTLSIVDVEKGLFWIKKGKEYQIVSIKNGKVNIYKTVYDFLYPIKFSIPHAHAFDEQVYLIAQYKNKWGVVDADSKILKSFDYDYALMSNGYSSKFYLVKNNQLNGYDDESWPNETLWYTGDKSVNSYKLVSNFNKVVFVNNEGQVVIPPQYKELYLQGEKDYKFVEDSLGHKKLVFLETGRMVDFPFDYAIKIATSKSRVIAVKDKKEFSYGVVSTEGKTLIPCNNYNIALADAATSTFFVKNDTPLVKRNISRYGNFFESERLNGDKLMIEDSNWFMYDSLGQKINNQAFCFPIRFDAGIGIGKQDKGFNLYNTDGKIVEPFVKNAQQKYPEGFNNIFKYKETGFYALFYNQGITPTMILTKKDGEVIINSGRYDGISKFYGQYALVSNKENVGLVDSFGREIIAPQDLWTISNHFMDSLDIPNVIPRAESKKKNRHYYDRIHQPISFDDGNRELHPDSLSINEKQKAAIWNLLLEKKRAKIIQTASSVCIPRVDLRANDRFLTVSSNFGWHSYTIPKRIVVADNTVAFLVSDSDYSYSENPDFYNFHHKNNRWAALQINDVLQIQGDKRWLFNDLITQKVKALKDAQIDCSNTSAFITTVENRFMLTKEGIDFCFASTENQQQLVIISFTWAELKPFLKMKIGD